MTIEDKLKNLIAAKYGTVLDFSRAVGIPNSTVANILRRGVLNANVENIIAMCELLGISVDALGEGKIVKITKKTKTETSDLADVYAELVHRLLIEDNLTIDGEPLSESERYTLADSLELDLEKIRRHHERERREK